MEWSPQIGVSEFDRVVLMIDPRIDDGKEFQSTNWKILFFRNIFFLTFYTRHTIVAGYYGFTLDVRVSVHPFIRLFFVSG